MYPHYCHPPQAETIDSREVHSCEICNDDEGVSYNPDAQMYHCHTHLMEDIKEMILNEEEMSEVNREYINKNITINVRG